MTVERRIELTKRIIEIGKQIAFESNVALAAHDSKKLDELKQQAIVLRNVTESLAYTALSDLENNEED